MKRKKNLCALLLLVLFAPFLLTGCFEGTAFEITEDANKEVEINILGFSLNTSFTSISGIHYNSISNTTEIKTNQVFYDMYKTGSDTYFCGDDIITVTPPGTVESRAIIIKNSTKSTLISVNSGAQSICLSGNNVYIAGFYTSGNPRACYWLNGSLNTLSTDLSLAYKIKIAGNDVYTCGFYNNNGSTDIACYWKNGVKHDLSAVMSRAYDIEIVDNDIYLCGNYYNGTTNVACYWKNGVKTDLSTSGSCAYDIEIVDNDIYLCGNYNNGTTNAACYWKNSNIITIPVFASLYTSIKRISILNQNIYVAGQYFNGNTLTVFYYTNNSIHEVGEINDSIYGDVTCIYIYEK